MNRIRTFLFLSYVLLFSCEKNIDWNVYGGSYKRTQFGNSEKLNLNNISNLKKVWEYSTVDNDNFSQIQTNPLIINGKFYGVSPKLKLFSLEAKSGSEIWVFDPFNSDYNFFEIGITFSVLFSSIPELFINLSISLFTSALYIKSLKPLY